MRIVPQTLFSYVVSIIFNCYNISNCYKVDSAYSYKIMNDPLKLSNVETVKLFNDYSIRRQLLVNDLDKYCKNCCK